MDKKTGLTPLEKNHKKMKRNFLTGLTLIEVIVSMVLVAITMVVTLQFFIFIQQNFVVKSRMKYDAANVAREQMEHDYWVDYSSLNATGIDTPIITPFTSANCGLSGATYTEKITLRNTITVGSNSYSPGYKLVTVSIKDWQR